MRLVWISMLLRTRSLIRHLETVDSEDWQRVSWIHLPHLDILHTAVESDTDMVCSSSRFQTASRLRCLTTGSRTDIHSSFVVRSTAMRSSLEDMCRRAQMKTESFISSRRTISRCLQCLMICL